MLYGYTTIENGSLYRRVTKKMILGNVVFINYGFVTFFCQFTRVGMPTTKDETTPPREGGGTMTRHETGETLW